MISRCSFNVMRGTFKALSPRALDALVAALVEVPERRVGLAQLVLHHITAAALPAAERLEVQQQPQVEGGVREADLHAGRRGFGHRLRDPGVLDAVEQRPGLVLGGLVLHRLDRLLLLVAVLLLKFSPPFASSGRGFLPTLLWQV